MGSAIFEVPHVLDCYYVSGILHRVSFLFTGTRYISSGMLRITISIIFEMCSGINLMTRGMMAKNCQVKSLEEKN